MPMTMTENDLDKLAPYDAGHVDAITRGHVNPALLRMWIARDFLTMAMVPTTQGKRRRLTKANIYEIATINLLARQGVPIEIAAHWFKKVIWPIIQTPAKAHKHVCGFAWRPDALGKGVEPIKFNDTVLDLNERFGPAVSLVSVYALLKEVDAELDSLDGKAGYADL